MLASRIASEPGFAVVGHVAGDADLLDLCQLSTPDVVLFDACSDGVAAATGTIGELRARFPRTRIVVIYERLTPDELAVTGPDGADALIPVSHGLDAMLVVLRKHPVRRDGGHAARDGVLTEQERQILTLTAAGHPVTTVAAILGVSPRTVDNCKRRAYHKLDVANQGQAIARAAALGLLRPVRPPRRPVHKPGRILAVLRGPNTPEREQARVALMESGVPFVVESNTPDSDQEPEVPHNVGPVLQVLVGPQPGTPPVADGLPTLVIRSAPMRREEALGLLCRGVVSMIAPDSIAEVLVPALTLAASGHLTVDPAVAAALLPGNRGGPLPQITSREGDILHSIAGGDTVRQTALSLGIAPKTVENIQARLFRKLGVRNRASAVAAARALGLLDQDAGDVP